MKIQKSIDFVSSNKNQLKMEIGRNVSFTRVTKTLKYLEINIIWKDRIYMKNTENLIEG